MVAQADSTAGAAPISTSPSLSFRSVPSLAYAPTFPPDTNPGRPRVAMLSNGYYTRLQIHLIASYFALPVMAAEYVLGQKILNEEQNGLRASSGLAAGHSIVAAGLVGLFGLNTVTGVLNLYEARHEPEGRVRRTIHSVLMLVADGGFAYTASLGGAAKLRRAGTGNLGTTLSNADRHKRAAIVSISIATASTLMMWLWKR